MEVVLGGFVFVVAEAAAGDHDALQRERANEHATPRALDARVTLE